MAFRFIIYKDFLCCFVFVSHTLYLAGFVPKLKLRREHGRGNVGFDKNTCKPAKMAKRRHHPAYNNNTFVVWERETME